MRLTPLTFLARIFLGLKTLIARSLNNTIFIILFSTGGGGVEITLNNIIYIYLLHSETDEENELDLEKKKNGQEFLDMQYIRGNSIE